MRQTPIILIAGNAGSGKDTVAEMIAEQVPGTRLVAQADEMKRLALKVFGFDLEQLWGPSHMRNAADPRATEDEEFSERVYANMEMDGEEWVDQLPIPEGEKNFAKDKLWQWLDSVVLEHRVISPRLVLQTLGTEWGRAVSQDVWSKHALNIAHTLLTNPLASYSKEYGLDIGADQGSVTNLVVLTDGRFRNEVLNVRKEGGVVVRVYDPKAKALQAGVAGHTSETELSQIPEYWFDLNLQNPKDGLDALNDRVSQTLVKVLW